jgi:hypothetical protein
VTLNHQILMVLIRLKGALGPGAGRHSAPARGNFELTHAQTTGRDLGPVVTIGPGDIGTCNGTDPAAGWQAYHRLPRESKQAPCPDPAATQVSVRMRFPGALPWAGMSRPFRAQPMRSFTREVVD